MDEQRLRRLMDVGRDLVSELDSEALLQRVLEVARELTAARYAALGILDSQRQHLERFITVGVSEETRAKIGELPRGRGVLGVLIDEPRPLRLQDVSEHPSTYGFPHGHPPMSSFLGVPILIRGRAWGNLYLTEKEGGDFDEQDEQAVVILAGWAAIAIENARLYGGVESQRDELERAVRALEATTDIARAVGGETELDRVLELIVKRGRALVEARTIVILLERGGELEVAATAGQADRELLGMSVPTEGSLCGDVLLSGRPERLSSSTARLRFALGEQMEVKAGMLVPLIFRSRALGVLAAFDRLGPDPEFGMEDQRLMLSFAASAATAVATAKSVAEERLQHRIEVSEQERKRWARELHDETLQGLGGLRVLLSTALRSGSPEGLREAVDRAMDQISAEIESLHGIITDLRPAALDQIGPKAAIEGLAERSRGPGLQVTTDIDLDYEAGRASERHPPELEAAIYRLVQEATTNAAKHGQARRIDIGVHELDERIEITVRDDGSGFDPGGASGGFGLIGMRERVELAGGDLGINSAPDEGTILRATIPTAARGSSQPEERNRAAS